jgi:ATP-binding cassette subfamily B protein/subfamily B ATP-binding cassette protein MsbA
MMGGVQGVLQGIDAKPQHRGATTARLLGELRPHIRALAGASALILVVAVCQALGPWLVSRAIDVDVAARDGRGLAGTLGAMLAVYLVGALAQRTQIFMIGAVGQRVLAALRERLFARFQALPIPFFDSRPLGDLMGRVSNDVDALNQLLAQGLTQSIGAVFGVVGILIAMLFLNVPLALVCLSTLPLMALTIWLLARQARAAYREARATTGAVMAELQEEIGGVREAQAFNRGAENELRFRERNQANRDANVRAAAATSAFAPAIDVLSALTVTVVVGVGAWLVLQGTLSLGLLAAFMLYIGQFFWPIQIVAQVTAQLQSALAGAERIYAILDEPAEVDTGHRPLGEGRGRVEYRDVDFAYVAGRPVLRGVSFVAEPGQTVAIVGPTGAGKTSIGNLLPRFYDVEGGSVLVDGVDVRDVPREALRSRIAVVAQEPFLFSGTVAENLAYGRPDATRDEITAMARAVGAHPFIEALPQGYDTPLGEGAGRLGHGQRQLLAIARAMLADRPILILDEATSHVDSATEAALQHALATALAGRTAIVIAHRLSTIRHADQILVVADGRIAERGTHDELLAAGGRYAELHRHHAAAEG